MAPLRRTITGQEDLPVCHDTDGRPPIPPIAGGALESGLVTLTSADGTAFAGYRARPATRTGDAVLILPDVRGLHPYYEDLALRFAEHGLEALAIDWFGRTAGVARRETGFVYMPHVEQTAWPSLAADIAAGAAWLRSADGGGGAERLFVVGFCFGGRLAFVSSTLGLDLSGVIGFYGNPAGPGRSGVPAPVDLAEGVASPILGLFGGADAGIPAASVAAFEAALRSRGVPHRLVVYPDAPHSFFDRKADEFVRTSEAAWAEVVAFLRDPQAARS
jgi:carboxymethylenebutenolidase